MKVVKPKVTLINFSGVEDAMIAASNCVSADDLEVIETKISKAVDSNDYKLLKNVIIDNGHHSIAEFIKFTFAIEGINLSTSHQWVRHRLVSNAQKSQRYITHKELVVSFPDSFSDSDKAKAAQLFDANWNFYNELIAGGMKAEDARGVLPQVVSTSIICSMNARELMHIINERVCTCAQAQIREVANKMLVSVKTVLPEIFDYVGPKCYNLGRCPEKRNGKGCQIYKKSPYYLKDK